jgi:DNA-binding PadR family transcriptional regulator
MSPRSADPLTLEKALLGFFRERPRHGYDLYQELSDPEGLWMVWRIKQSQLYALLGRLEERGLLSATLEPRGERPPRKVYRLTDVGRAVYRAWVEAPVEHGRQFRLDFLAKLFFVRSEGAETAAVLIDRQRAACSAWLGDLEASARAVPDAAPFQQLVLQYRIGQVHAMLGWLDACEHRLTTPAPNA